MKVELSINMCLISRGLVQGARIFFGRVEAERLILLSCFLVFFFSGGEGGGGGGGGEGGGGGLRAFRALEVLSFVGQVFGRCESVVPEASGS